MSILNIILVIVALGGVALLIGSGGDASQDVRKRLEEYGDTQMDVSSSLDPMEDEELKKNFFDRVVRPITKKFAGVMAKKSKKDEAELLKKELGQAGNPGNLSPQEFKALKLLVMLVFPALTFILGLLFRVSVPIVVIFAAVVFTISFLVPRIYVQRKVAFRKKEIVRSLPDCLDLLTVSVEAGLGFDQALQKVTQKFKGALAEELSYVLQEVQMGKKRSDALRGCANKMEVDDLTSFISALVQADSLGVSVASVLHVQSEQARERRKQRAEELAMKAPVKMLFPMVGCIFPTIMVVLLGGAAMKFATAFTVPGVK